MQVSTDTAPSASTPDSADPIALWASTCYSEPFSHHCLEGSAEQKRYQELLQTKTRLDPDTSNGSQSSSHLPPISLHFQELLDFLQQTFQTEIYLKGGAIGYVFHKMPYNDIDIVLYPGVSFTTGAILAHVMSFIQTKLRLILPSGVVLTEAEVLSHYLRLRSCQTHAGRTYCSYVLGVFDLSFIFDSHRVNIARAEAIGITLGSRSPKLSLLPMNGEGEDQRAFDTCLTDLIEREFVVVRGEELEFLPLRQSQKHLYGNRVEASMYAGHLVPTLYFNAISDFIRIHRLQAIRAYFFAELIQYAIRCDSSTCELMLKGIKPAIANEFHSSSDPLERLIRLFASDLKQMHHIPKLLRVVTFLQSALEDVERIISWGNDPRGFFAFPLGKDTYYLELGAHAGAIVLECLEVLQGKPPFPPEKGGAQLEEMRARLLGRASSVEDLLYSMADKLAAFSEGSTRIRDLNLALYRALCSMTLLHTKRRLVVQRCYTLRGAKMPTLSDDQMRAEFKVGALSRVELDEVMLSIEQEASLQRYSKVLCLLMRDQQNLEVDHALWLDRLVLNSLKGIAAEQNEGDFANWKVLFELYTRKKAGKLCPSIFWKRLPLAMEEGSEFFQLYALRGVKVLQRDRYASFDEILEELIGIFESCTAVVLAIECLHLGAFSHCISLPPLGLIRAFTLSVKELKIGEQGETKWDARIVETVLKGTFCGRMRRTLKSSHLPEIMTLWKALKTHCQSFDLENFQWVLQQMMEMDLFDAKSFEEMIESLQNFAQRPIPQATYLLMQRAHSYHQSKSLWPKPPSSLREVFLAILPEQQLYPEMHLEELQQLATSGPKAGRHQIYRLILKRGDVEGILFVLDRLVEEVQQGANLSIGLLIQLLASTQSLKRGDVTRALAKLVMPRIYESQFIDTVIESGCLKTYMQALQELSHKDAASSRIAVYLRQVKRGLLKEDCLAKTLRPLNAEFASKDVTVPEVLLPSISHVLALTNRRLQLDRRIEAVSVVIALMMHIKKHTPLQKWGPLIHTCWVVCHHSPPLELAHQRKALGTLIELSALEHESIEGRHLLRLHQNFEALGAMDEFMFWWVEKLSLARTKELQRVAWKCGMLLIASRKQSVHSRFVRSVILNPKLPKCFKDPEMAPLFREDPESNFVGIPAKERFELFLERAAHCELTLHESIRIVNMAGGSGMDALPARHFSMVVLACLMGSDMIHPGALQSVIVKAKANPALSMHPKMGVLLELFRRNDLLSRIRALVKDEVVLNLDALIKVGVTYEGSLEQKVEFLALVATLWARMVKNSQIERLSEELIRQRERIKSGPNLRVGIPIQKQADSTLQCALMIFGKLLHHLTPDLKRSSDPKVAQSALGLRYALLDFAEALFEKGIVDLDLYLSIYTEDRDILRKNPARQRGANLQMLRLLGNALERGWVPYIGYLNLSLAQTSFFDRDWLYDQEYLEALVQMVKSLQRAAEGGLIQEIELARDLIVDLDLFFRSLFSTQAIRRQVDRLYRTYSLPTLPWIETSCFESDEARVLEAFLNVIGPFIKSLSMFKTVSDVEKGFGMIQVLRVLSRGLLANPISAELIGMMVNLPFASVDDPRVCIEVMGNDLNWYAHHFRVQGVKQVEALFLSVSQFRERGNPVNSILMPLNTFLDRCVREKLFLEQDREVVISCCKVLISLCASQKRDAFLPLIEAIYHLFHWVDDISSERPYLIECLNHLGDCRQKMIDAQKNSAPTGGYPERIHFAYCALLSKRGVDEEMMVQCCAQISALAPLIVIDPMASQRFLQALVPRIQYIITPSTLPLIYDLVEILSSKLQTASCLTLMNMLTITLLDKDSTQLENDWAIYLRHSEPVWGDEKLLIQQCTHFCSLFLAPKIFLVREKVIAYASRLLEYKSKERRVQAVQNALRLRMRQFETELQRHFKE